MIVKSAEFVTSVSDVKDLSSFDDMPQITFVGRSNVGKSSLINYIANRKNLAKTSSTPGRTRLINFFRINDEFYFVDLPGYGFAQASKSTQNEWQALIGGYLQSSKSLKLVCVLVDVRHEPSKLDVEMVQYLYTYGIPFCIIATKQDKVGKSELHKNIQIIANTFGVGTQDVLYVSSEKKLGKERVLERINSVLDN